MPRPCSSRVLLALTAALVLGGAAPARTGARTHAASFQDLVALFNDWRNFQKPKVVDGVPDYSEQAMRAQRGELPAYQRRLAAIDTAGWPIAQRADYLVVKAEMNGLDFDQRVMRPWERDPAFYVMIFPARSDQPVREGPHMYGMIEEWTYQFPLTQARAEDLGARLRTIPKILDAAKANLTGNAHDFWVIGIRAMDEQSKTLEALATKAAGSHPDIGGDIQRAREATDQFRAWLEQQLPSKTGPSGIGVENYNWVLKNVQLVPYTWSDEVAIMRSELYRSTSALKLEELHSKNVPPLNPIANADDYHKRFQAAVTEYMAALRDQGIITIKPYMDPELRAREHPYSQPGPLEFSRRANDEDPEIMLTHSFHWFDLGQMEQEPNPDPIRRGALLYNIFDSRTEGFATAMEEMMGDAGVFDSHPHSREMVYWLVAWRAARALGDLRMASNEFTYDQAMKYEADETPRGWLREGSHTVFEEQALYLEQPTYGTSYVMGKLEAEQLLSDYAKKFATGFSMQRFMDEFTADGLIPTSLVRWQMTGRDDDIKWLASEAGR